MAKVNYQSIRSKIGRSKALQTRIDKKVETNLSNAKAQYINQFENHPVTKEIESGPDARNLSNTLGGIGNLFSFIGFNKGTNPVLKIKDLIKNSFYIEKKRPTIIGSKIKFNYRIRYPGLQELESVSPMPWESGRSWISSIERSISGFGFYMYKKFNKSRSGTGIQTENEIRSGAFKSTRYMSQIIKDFVINIKKK